MKTALLVFIMLHGLLHLLGFLKAFELAKIEELKQPVSKISGLFWLIAFLIFTVTAVLYLIEIPLGIGLGFSGIILSQILIIQAWEDAKFGTIPNIFLGILLVVSI